MILCRSLITAWKILGIHGAKINGILAKHRFFPKKCRAFSSEDEHSYQNLFFLYYEFPLTRELTNAQKGVRPFPIQTEHTEIEERRSWGPLNKHALLETVRRLTSPHKTRERPHPEGNQKRPGSQEAHATDQGRYPWRSVDEATQRRREATRDRFFRSSTGLPCSFILRVCFNL